MDEPVCSIPDPLAFWGKYNEQATPCAHPLTDHCLDVATVFRRLVGLPRIREALQRTTRSSLLTDRQLNRLTAIAYLHDLGKCNWGFQAKRDAAARETAGHVLEAVTLLRDDALFERWPDSWRQMLTRMASWFEHSDAELLEVLLAAVSHHGRPVSDSDYAHWSDRNPARWWMPRHGVDPMLGLAELADAVQVAFPDAFVDDGATLEATPALQQRFAGLVMLADWIGSDTRFFAYRQSRDEARQALAKQAAAHALRTIGLDGPHDRQARHFTQVFGFDPSPLQGNR